MGRFHTGWTKLSAYFSVRGYLIVTKAFLEVNKLSRKETLTEKDNFITDDSKKMFCILDFNPSLPPIRELIKE